MIIVFAALFMFVGFLLVALSLGHDRMTDYNVAQFIVGCGFLVAGLIGLWRL